MQIDIKNKLCGIDEAGRGPFAGPLVVAGVILNNDIEGLNDSKKISEKIREKLFDIIKDNSSYHIVFTSNEDIDKYGLSLCLKNSINEIMEHLDTNNFLMDGNTTYGIENLKCLIKADATIKEVSAASILAKVSRDRYMINISDKYPEYNFQRHKGYGTKAHIDAIIKYGYCDLHRRSFKIKRLNVINIQQKKNSKI